MDSPHRFTVILRSNEFIEPGRTLDWYSEQKRRPFALLGFYPNLAAVGFHQVLAYHKSQANTADTRVCYQSPEWLE